MGNGAKRGEDLRPSDDTTLPVQRVEAGSAGPAGALVSGRRVGNYMILEELAAGGFGVVYKVENVVLGRMAALKVLHEELVTSGEVLARFVREARAANRIRHPNLVDIYDFGEMDDGRPYFVMELLEGTDLDVQLSDRGRLSPAETLEVLEPLCDVLSVAHAGGIIHRDLKASNVFLSWRGDERRIVLLDFGVAKLIEPGGPDLTTSGTVLGTPACMAPEQIAGGPVGPRADIYALGALTYHMLTGQLPFVAETVTEMKHFHLTAPRPRVSSLTSVSFAVDAVIGRAMHIKAEQRYAGALDFFAAVKQALVGASEPVSAVSTECSAVALFVDPRIDLAALEDPDDQLIDDLESIASLAQTLLGSRGFLLARQFGHTMLFVRLLDASPDLARQLRRASLDAARGFCAALASRSAPDRRVHVNLAVHAGAVRVMGDKLKDGPLLDAASWAPDERVEGVHASPEVLAGLG